MPLTQEEFDAKYPLVIGWIEQTLAAHARKARTLASMGFTRLPHYYSAELLDSAKVVYVDDVPTPPLTRLGLAQFAELEELDTAAMTYLNTVFALKEARDYEPLHFHELIHVVQWKLLGPRKFVAAYAEGLERFGYRNSPLEVMAYDAEVDFVKSPQPFDVEKLVKNKLGIP